MSAWLVIITVGLGSYALRSIMLVLAASSAIPQRFADALALVGPAAIGALVATMTLTSDGRLDPLPFAELAAIAAGFVAARRTGNVMHAFTVGLPTLWLITAVTP